MDHLASRKVLSAGAGGWHVASENRLVHVVNMPQSVRTMVDTVNGTSCIFTVTDALKLGFSEYKFTASYSSWEFYNRYENLNPNAIFAEGHQPLADDRKIGLIEENHLSVLNDAGGAVAHRVWSADFHHQPDD